MQYYFAQRLIEKDSNDSELSKKIDFILDIHNLFMENPNLIKGEVVNKAFVDKMYNEFLKRNSTTLDLSVADQFVLVDRQKLKLIPHHYFSSQLITQEIFRTLLGYEDIVIDLGGGTGRLLHYMAKFYYRKDINSFPLRRSLFDG